MLFAAAFSDPSSRTPMQRLATPRPNCEFDSAVSLVGLRAPRPDEAPSAFGDYVLGMRDGLSGVPYPIFTLAAEDVDFNGIFR